MKNTKIAWLESQYLFPHHFQQQERYFESLIEQRSGAIAPYVWGFEQLELNEALLSEGRLALNSGTGVMPDGCPFEMPVSADLPSPLLLDRGVKNQLIYLALPIYQAGSRHINTGDQLDTVARYVLKELEVYDYSSASKSQELIETAGLRFQLLPEAADRGGFTTLPIARVREVTQEGAVLLDNTFIPPSLNVRQQARLKHWLADTIGLIKQRADILANRFSDDNKDKSAAAIVDFMLLQLLNRHEPLLRHLQERQQTHPETLFAALQVLSGELSTFTTRSKRVLPQVSYEHNDLNQCFSTVCQSLNKQLSVVLEQTALSLPVEKRQYGIFVARLSDRSLISQARFILGIKASMPTDKLRSYLPSHLKIGSIETIRDLVNNQLTGITVSGLPVAPREITYHTGYVYFELDAENEHWQALSQSAGFAFHIAGELSNLELEFWAIRKS